MLAKDVMKSASNLKEFVISQTIGSNQQMPRISRNRNAISLPRFFCHAHASSHSCAFLTIMRIWMKDTTMMHRPRITAIAEDMPATCFLTEFS